MGDGGRLAAQRTGEPVGVLTADTLLQRCELAPGHSCATAANRAAVGHLRQFDALALYSDDPHPGPDGYQLIADRLAPLLTLPV